MPAQAASSGDGARLLAPNGTPMFIEGMNYEGPPDRAWMMWQSDKFDAGLIEADFVRASDQAGINVLRVFVQPPLITDIAAGNWAKFDAVVGLAEKHKIQLIVSLHDYSERDLSKVSAVAGQIAQHYRGRSGILGFDLKNEPRFGDLALSIYKSPVPLQQRGLIDTYGERLARDQLADYRASDDGVKTIPSYLNDDQAWIYVNNLRLYRELLADQSDPKWSTFLDALNASLDAWIQPQLQAIRAADSSRLITIDHVDTILARLPANDALDFESLHRYPADTGASIRANLNLLTNIEAAHPGKPLVLSEFGYATETLDADKAAIAETAIMLGLIAHSAAGGAKWMLNDMPPGFNLRERTLGAFRLDGSPKPVVASLAALRAYVDGSGSPPGDLSLQDDPDTGVKYIYRAEDAVLLGGKKVDSSGVSFEAAGPAQLFVTWSVPGVVHVWASTAMTATIDLGEVSGGPKKLNLKAGATDIGTPAQRGADYDIPNGHFFTQTNGRAKDASGFAVTNEDGVPLWTGFKSLGGVDVLGYPVTRRFEMDGFVVQAFQKSVLQWRPDQKGFAFLNTFDVLHDRGKDDWLAVYRQTPPPLDNAADAGLGWDRIVARHLALLDKVPQALKAAFLSDADWIDHYGLPESTQETQASVVVRAQRAALQYWKQDVPWAAKGSVSVANGGDLAKEAGLFPWLAVTAENAPR